MGFGKAKEYEASGQEGGSRCEETILVERKGGFEEVAKEAKAAEVVLVQIDGEMTSPALGSTLPKMLH